jgi:hypothetical protein
MSHLMQVLPTIGLYGVPLSLVLVTLITATLWHHPGLLLHSYPDDVRAALPSATSAERWASVGYAAIFLLLLLAFPFAAAVATKAANRDFLEVFLSAFGVAFLFNLADWLIVDWLIICTITPDFVVLPGTAGMPGYKNYRMHFRGFLAGSALSVVLGLLMAVMSVWI